MVEVHEVGSADDPRVADYRRLNDHAFRRSVEAGSGFAAGTFVAEGWLAVERLIGSRYPTRSILVDADRLDRVTDLVGMRPIPVFAAPRALLAEIVGFDLHRGVVANASRERPLLWDDLMARSRRLVITEGVNDAENLGVIARNAAALGADGLVVDATTCDPLSRRTVRVSTGHILTLPWCRTPLDDALGALAARGWTIVALSPNGTAGHESIKIDEVAVVEPMAIVVGAEGPGLSATTIEAASVVTAITMHRGADSINVGSAVAIACHRLFSSGGPDDARGR